MIKRSFFIIAILAETFFSSDSWSKINESLSDKNKTYLQLAQVTNPVNSSGYYYNRDGYYSYYYYNPPSPTQTPMPVAIPQQQIPVPNYGYNRVNNNNAYAQNSKKGNAVFLGGSALKNSVYGYIGAIRAINGDIYRSGYLLRVDGGYGKYNYNALTSNLRNDDGSQYVSDSSTTNVRVNITSGSLMTGYQAVFGASYFTAYIGGNFDNYANSKQDSSSSVSGGKPGVKGQIEFLLAPFSVVSFSSSSSISSAFTSYYSRNSLDFHCCGFSFGPEATFLGNKAYNQQRYGLSISDISFWSIKLSLSGGYAELTTKSNNGDNSSDTVSNSVTVKGAYGSIGLSTIF